jgi:hypothetical protein
MWTEIGSLVGKVSSMAWSSRASRFSCEFSARLLSGGHSPDLPFSGGKGWLLALPEFMIEALHVTLRRCEHETYAIRSTPGQEPRS